MQLSNVLELEEAETLNYSLFVEHWFLAQTTTEWTDHLALEYSNYVIPEGMKGLDADKSYSCQEKILL